MTAAVQSAVAVPVRSDWLRRFHEGDQATLRACYDDYFDVVARAVTPLCDSIDRESVIHDVFLKLISDEDARRNYRGGSFASWITTVARNRAIDTLRRHRRELVVEPKEAQRLVGRAGGNDPTAQREAADLLGRFQRQVLPAKWAGVFVARFLEQRDQRDAARVVGISRTTLAYREHRIRRLLRRFWDDNAP